MRTLRSPDFDAVCDVGEANIVESAFNVTNVEYGWLSVEIKLYWAGKKMEMMVS
jgi:hypothetical protein